MLLLLSALFFELLQLLYWNISGYIQRTVYPLKQGHFFILMLSRHATEMPVKYVRKILVLYYI